MHNSYQLVGETLGAVKNATGPYDARNPIFGWQ